MFRKFSHVRLFMFAFHSLFFLLQAAAQNSGPVQRTELLDNLAGQNPAIVKTPRSIRCSSGLNAARTFGQIAFNRLPGLPRAVALKSSIPQAKGHSFGAFWKVGDGYTSTLILRNKDSENPIVANVVLFSHDGSVEQRTQFEVGANAVGR